jgi:general secretion pathway protein J
MTPSSRSLPRRDAGFTLVEVLVALLIMAILATMAWQGLDGILRAREGSRASIDRSAQLATVLTQWEQDLQGLYDTTVVPPLSFDGQTLRLTRRAEGGVMLVAWSVRGGLWQRWTGPVLVHSAEVQQSWLRSQQLLGTEAGQLTLSEGASAWQVYFSRSGQWSNAQSTGDLVAQPALPPASPSASAPEGAAAAPLREALPEGVRLVITLAGQTLTRDIALGPAGS